MTFHNGSLEALRRVHRGDERIAAGDNRRQRGRVHMQQLRCTLGTVTDLSGSGMRLLSRRLHRDDLGRTVLVHFEQAQPMLALPAVVVWIRRAGLLRHVVGLRFLGLTEAQQCLVLQLAHAHSLEPSS
ncbi:MAG: PilZ domain-containing protein [Phycisphaerales bacterium JB038]